MSDLFPVNQEKDKRKDKDKDKRKDKDKGKKTNTPAIGPLAGFCLFSVRHFPWLDVTTPKSAVETDPYMKLNRDDGSF